MEVRGEKHNHNASLVEYFDYKDKFMLPEHRRPTHPGEILRYEFLEPLKLTQQQLADAIGVTRVRINEIILGKRSVTADTAFRLSKFFNTTPEFWINLQTNFHRR